MRQGLDDVISIPALTALAIGDSSGEKLIVRCLFGLLTSLLLVWLIAPRCIRWLAKVAPERIVSDSQTLNQLHAAKQRTPSMGGLMLLVAVLISAVFWTDLQSPCVPICIATIVLFAILGAADDLTKLLSSRNGFKGRVKFAIQCSLALGISFWIWHARGQSGEHSFLYIPFLQQRIPLGVTWILWSTVVIVAASNAVNLTDGLDGLASGCTIFCCLTVIVLAAIAGQHACKSTEGMPTALDGMELSVLLSAVVGALLAFLKFNRFPAKVFMGDTGSLPLGAVLAVGFLWIHQELLFMIAGGVFVVEAVSVILQVGWYRLTGQRLIRCSPLHNHYVFRGDPEPRIVARFWLSSAVLAASSLLVFKFS